MTALPTLPSLPRPSQDFRTAGIGAAAPDRATSLAHVLGLAGFLLLPITVFAPLGAAPLLGVAGLLALLTGGRRLEAAWRPLGPAIAVILLLLVLGAISVRWSVVPVASLRLVGQLSLTAAASLLVIGGALVLSPSESRIVRLWLVAGLTLGMILLAVEWRWEGLLLRFFTHRTVASLPSVTRLDRGETALAALVWPGASAVALLLGRDSRAGAWLGRALAAGLVILAFVLTTRLVGAAGKVALVLGAIGFLLACLAPRLTARLSAVVALALGLLMPLAPPLVEVGTMAYPGKIEFSTMQRVAIWYFVADRVAERPLTGWGLDASRAMPGGGGQAVLPSGSALPAGSESLPLHPHNNALQWWLELGVGGALLGGLLIALAFWGAGNRAPRTGVAAGAAIMLVMMVSYGAWQFWWLATIALVTAMVVAISAPLMAVPAWRPGLRTLSGRERY